MRDAGLPIRGFSLWQPWASLVAIGAKRFETRDWRVGYRGYLAIHATKKFTKDDMELAEEDYFKEALAVQYGSAKDLPTSAIVAVVRLMNIFPSEWFAMEGQEEAAERATLLTGNVIRISKPEMIFGNYDPNRFGWQLEERRQLRTPLPCKGAQGLWSIPADVLPQLRQAWHDAA